MHRIGAHMSIAGGHAMAIDRAVAIGANALQIFSSPPQRWDSPVLSETDAKLFRDRSTASDVLPIYLHGCYLINLASSNSDIVQKSKQSLIADLRFCHQIGATGVIFHFGSAEGGWKKRRDYLTFAIKEILDQTPEDTEFIIENAAGNGFKIGSSLEELAMMITDLHHPRVKICIDTAHALAAGYEFRTAESAKTFTKQVDSLIGWKNVAAIHCNDSKVDIGKKKDLHENIGEGCIGLDGFLALLHMIPDTIPLILETPGDDREGPNKENIERVKTILTKKL